MAEDEATEEAGDEGRGRVRGAFRVSAWPAGSESKQGQGTEGTMVGRAHLIAEGSIKQGCLGQAGPTSLSADGCRGDSGSTSIYFIMPIVK